MRITALLFFCFCSHLLTSQNFGNTIFNDGGIVFAPLPITLIHTKDTTKSKSKLLREGVVYPLVITANLAEEKLDARLQYLKYGPKISKLWGIESSLQTKTKFKNLFENGDVASTAKLGITFGLVNYMDKNISRTEKDIKDRSYDLSSGYIDSIAWSSHIYYISAVSSFTNAKTVNSSNSRFVINPIREVDYSIKLGFNRGFRKLFWGLDIPFKGIVAISASYSSIDNLTRLDDKILNQVNTIPSTNLTIPTTQLLFSQTVKDGTYLEFNQWLYSLDFLLSSTKFREISLYVNLNHAILSPESTMIDTTKSWNLNGGIFFNNPKKGYAPVLGVIVGIRDFRERDISLDGKRFSIGLTTSVNFGAFNTPIVPKELSNETELN